MLAYLLWHLPAEDVDAQAYEHATDGFHRSLAHSPPAGFHGSAAYRAQQPPWLGALQDGRGAAGWYEDWYLVEDFAALGVLNAAAVGRGHRTAHDEIARRMGRAAGGLYELLEGTVKLARERVTVWVDRTQDAKAPTFAALLGDGMDPRLAGLLRRSLVLGPAPEYCVLADEVPAGVAATPAPGVERDDRDARRGQRVAMAPSAPRDRHMPACAVRYTRLARRDWRSSGGAHHREAAGLVAARLGNSEHRRLTAEA